mmetsp:Transcript_11013/g.34069  ORF Transcript_11013/g.34069 Transcript_11013/m.34069 type:complete len:204 (-) Transcript_11013:637-1248(-)
MVVTMKKTTQATKSTKTTGGTMMSPGDSRNTSDASRMMAMAILMRLMRYAMTMMYMAARIHAAYCSARHSRIWSSVAVSPGSFTFSRSSAMSIARYPMRMSSARMSRMHKYTSGFMIQRSRKIQIMEMMQHVKPESMMTSHDCSTSPKPRLKNEPTPMKSARSLRASAESPTSDARVLLSFSFWNGRQRKMVAPEVYQLVKQR